MCVKKEKRAIHTPFCNLRTGVTVHPQCAYPVLIKLKWWLDIVGISGIYGAATSLSEWHVREGNQKPS